ncbi:Cytoplasmic dynein 2 light intermediate chain 1 [Gryllus bimaculatus]|nr:Cytoplasmic dynein 2 light intermediate chain 1 [Gryllus bimaculatus]
MAKSAVTRSPRHEMLYDIGMPTNTSTLKDIAVKQCNDIYDGLIIPANQPREHTVLFIGSKGVGKTSLITRFLDREETPKSTLALEYTYGRKSRKSLVKDICHIWELGGGSVLVPLLDAPLASLTSLHNLSVVLMLDLSAPHHLWFTLETLLKAVLASVRKNAGSDMQSLQEAAWNLVGMDHPDREFLDPFPVPLVILGGKYDKFQDFDPEKKKAVCRSLRYVAHTLGASLQFYSLKEPGLIKKAKDLLSYHGFGTSPIKSISQDYNKPLIIPPGSDSMQQIGGLGSVGMPPRNRNVAQKGPGAALEHWKHTFTTHFPQEASEKNVMPEDPCKDLNYLEPVIDDLRMQKDEELELYCREVERRSKFRSDLDLDI